MADSAQTQSFIAALVDLIQADSEAGLSEVEGIRDSALARIKKGNGQIGFLTSGSINGKNATFFVGMSCIEVFAATSEAIRIYAGTQPSIAYADFSCFQR